MFTQGHAPHPRHPPPPQVTDCLYCGAYAVLFSSLLALGLSVIDAPAAMHTLNLVPITTAVIDVLENTVMLALLAFPRDDLARVAVSASSVKWQLITATASLVAGTGAFCVYKAIKSPKGRRRGGEEAGGAAAGAAAAEGQAAAEGEGARVRKSVRRA